LGRGSAWERCGFFLGETDRRTLASASSWAWGPVSARLPRHARDPLRSHLWVL